MAERAIRNRTITLSTTEEQYYKSRLLTISHPTNIEDLRDSTINQDAFESLPLLTGQSIDLLFIDPPSIQPDKIFQRARLQAKRP